MLTIASCMIFTILRRNHCFPIKQYNTRVVSDAQQETINIAKEFLSCCINKHFSL